MMNLMQAVRSLTKASIIPHYRHFFRCSALLKSADNSADKPEKVSTSKLEEARELLPKRFKVFDDTDTEIIYDESVNLDELLNRKKKKMRFDVDKTKKTNLRGEEGVFDIHELVSFLRDENFRDIATIWVPKEMKYCDYMVICTATSNRHMKNFLETLNKLYKIKKHKTDPFLLLDDESPDWRLVDLGNINLHIFLQDTRAYYDIETLWTVGEKYDEKTQRQTEDIVTNIMDKHMSFIKQQAKIENTQSGQ